MNWWIEAKYQRYMYNSFSLSFPKQWVMVPLTKLIYYLWSSNNVLYKIIAITRKCILVPIWNMSASNKQELPSGAAPLIFHIRPKRINILMKTSTYQWLTNDPLVPSHFQLITTCIKFAYYIYGKVILPIHKLLSNWSDIRVYI